MWKTKIDTLIGYFNKFSSEQCFHAYTHNSHMAQEIARKNMGIDVWFPYRPKDYLAEQSALAITKPAVGAYCYPSN